MPGLLIKDIPVELHYKLKARAAKNKRSMTKEALFILEQTLTSEPVNVTELPAPIQGKFLLTDEWIDAAKRMGRE